MDELTKMRQDLEELKRKTDLLDYLHERNSRIRKAIGFIESTANVHLDKSQKLMIEGELSGLILFGIEIIESWTDKIQEEPETTEPETTEPEEEEEEEEEELDPDEQWAESEEAQELAEEEYKEDLQSYYNAIK